MSYKEQVGSSIIGDCYTLISFYKLRVAAGDGQLLLIDAQTLTMERNGLCMSSPRFIFMNIHGGYKI